MYVNTVKSDFEVHFVVTLQQKQRLGIEVRAFLCQTFGPLLEYAQLPKTQEVDQRAEPACVFY
jgi:hypothetical protein